MPDYAQVRAAWQPSEAWLYDRNGVLIDSSRVDFARAAARLDAARQGRAAGRARRWSRPRIIASTRMAASTGWRRSAALRDRLEGKPSRGASTLSMQVAGFLAPDLARAGRARLARQAPPDARRPARSTARGARTQILEAYLNLAGFRGEAQGIGAAALGLFGKTPDALSRDDALLLAALLPDPQAGAATGRAARLRAGARQGLRALRRPRPSSMLGPARSLRSIPASRRTSRSGC